ncbi:hypothetical protein WICMUC_000133 [Wickerhamomyces mucosus]|uniref:Ino eighty subunit 1 n=1 Tax=Wickerhamomyces mucosus TaxID=1378264 RepID=A0A9P8PZ10_9ASCO|nr:hypothetical protein WICMUC_000133 [Wickerhamomyces mucosus]
MHRYDPIHDVYLDEPSSSLTGSNEAAGPVPVSSGQSDISSLLTTTTTAPLAPTASVSASTIDQDESTETEGEDDRVKKLSTSKAEGKATPSKKSKKSAANKTATVLVSARSRHLKKEDGHPFTRKDIQFAFLRALFDNKVKAFSDPFPDLQERVKLQADEDRSEEGLEVEDTREYNSEEKLTFAELYIKTIAHSSKCSKILRDRLLNDFNTSIPTCMICLLVNVGRMNTTINFVPDMKSQLRTYHSIPVLQLNYEKRGVSNSNSDKQLQDTPRLKSILKACCDDTHEPNDLQLLTTFDKNPKTNIVNLLFLFCNNEDAVAEKFLNYSFFDIFINSNHDPKDRATLLLWLIYNYLETKLSDGEVSENPFGNRPEVKKIDEEYDKDTEEEIKFGQTMLEERKLYLEDENFYNETKIESREKRRKLEESNKKPETPIKTQPHREPHPKTIKAKVTKPSKGIKKPVKIEVLPKPSKPSKPSKPAPQVIYRQDIDVNRVKKVLNELQKNNEKRRLSQGLLKFTNDLILTPYHEIRDGRLRLKSYQGDYVEYSSKFMKLFKFLKGDYKELSKDVIQSLTVDIEYGYKNDDDLTLDSFDINV